MDSQEELETSKENSLTQNSMIIDEIIKLGHQLDAHLINQKTTLDHMGRTSNKITIEYNIKHATSN
tara:strand:- start:505 stop:702 length:198 start_codon:yes stop_codon:yes gene_type:complete